MKLLHRNKGHTVNKKNFILSLKLTVNFRLMNLIHMNHDPSIVNMIILYMCLTNLNTFLNKYCINLIVKIINSNDILSFLDRIEIFINNTYVHIQHDLDLVSLRGSHANHMKYEVTDHSDFCNNLYANCRTTFSRALLQLIQK